MIAYTPPQHKSLDIVFKDNHLLILNKPSGLLSVPGRGEGKQDCLAKRVQAEYPEALIVHRLDMSTSGLIMMARSKKMERTMSIMFQQRNIKKSYIAVVTGRVNPGFGEINLPIITDWPNRPKQKIDFLHGKTSKTRYEVIAYNEKLNCSRIRLIPVTGRSHQLRIHMQSIGHAIIADELYAPKDAIRKADRLLLHASYLSFVHPLTHKLVEVESKPEF